jgi:hypothetical protein
VTMRRLEQRASREETDREGGAGQGSILLWTPFIVAYWF